MISSVLSSCSSPSFTPAPVCKSAVSTGRTLGFDSNADRKSSVAISLTSDEHRALLTAITCLRFENLKLMVSLSKSSNRAASVAMVAELGQEGAFLDAIVAKLSARSHDQT